MKYATFSLFNDRSERIGVVRGDEPNDLLDLQKLIGSSWNGPFPTSMQQLVDAGPAVWRKVAELVEELAARNLAPGTRPRREEVLLHAPLPRPRKNVFCLGINYVAHMEEGARARGRQVKIPEVPVFFTKPLTAVTGPFDPIPWDRTVTSQVDWEAELAVVIGVGGKNISRSNAWEHIFGYTIINDVSARDLQQSHYQWFKGKSLDGFCPMGPLVVTADEFGDPHKKKISLRVNGVIKQNASTADLIFSIPIIIEYLSQGLTLEPGDLISTGTPEGVGLGRIPPEYLQDGDLVETEIEGIGVLRNRVVATSTTK